MVLGQKHGTNYLPYTLRRNLGTGFFYGKRKRDLKSEQKKGGAWKDCPKKRIKKDSLLQPDYLDIL